MAQYNIEMNSFNGSQYNQLYPQTLLNNIMDWSNTIYNKTETDGFISTINSSISQINNSVSTLNIKQETIARVNISETSKSSFVVPSTIEDCFLVALHSDIRNGYSSGGLNIYTSSSMSSTPFISSGSLGLTWLCFQDINICIYDAGGFNSERGANIEEDNKLTARTYYYSSGDSGVLYIYGYKLST